MRRPIDDSSGSEQIQRAQRSRRSYLATIATAGAVGLAGCGGGGGGGDDAEENDSAGSGDENPSTGDGGNGSTGDADGSDGGDGGCGPSSMTFETVQFSNVDAQGPVASVRLPESATISRGDYVHDIDFPWGAGGRYSYEPAVKTDTTVQDYEEGDEFEGKTEITGEYQLAVEGTRVFRWGDGTTLPQYVDMYIPLGQDTLVVYFTRLRTGCPEAVRTALDEMIRSTQPA